MGGGKREDLSIEATINVLRVLGCPNPRRGEGSDEWERSKGSFRFTPDLIAGRLVGGGSATDFYIDVFQPTGDQYVKPRAGSHCDAKVPTKVNFDAQKRVKMSNCMDSRIFSNFSKLLGSAWF